MRPQPATVASGPVSEKEPLEVTTGRFDPILGSLVADRYLVREVIASGGMGRVYRAAQVSVDRDVALKVVLWEGEQPDDWAKRFRLEASLLGRLRHPNIVTVYDYGEIGQGPLKGRSYIAMELVNGITMEEVLISQGRFEAKRVLPVILQVAKALRYAHERGILHRDLKPSNIMLVSDFDSGETAKLVDFGVGKVLSRHEAPLLRARASVVGTPEFMAPEQAQGRSSASSDVFALGVILFEALAGRLPFDEPAIDEDGKLVPRHTEARRLRELAPDLDVPEATHELLASVLALDPRERPTLDGMIVSLETSVASVASSARTTKPSECPPSVVNASAMPDARPIHTLMPEVAAAYRSKAWTVLGVALVLVALTAVLLVLRGASSSAQAPREPNHLAARAPRRLVRVTGAAAKLEAPSGPHAAVMPASVAPASAAPAALRPAPIAPTSSKSTVAPVTPTATAIIFSTATLGQP